MLFDISRTLFLKNICNQTALKKLFATSTPGISKTSMMKLDRWILLFRRPSTITYKKIILQNYMLHPRFPKRIKIHSNLNLTFSKTKHTTGFSRLMLHVPPYASSANSGAPPFSI